LQQELAALPLHQHTAHLALWGRARGYWFNDVTPELLQLETSLWQHTEALEDSFTLPQLQTDIHVWWAAATCTPWNGQRTGNSNGLFPGRIASLSPYRRR
jgi:hypothetical protein